MSATSHAFYVTQDDPPSKRALLKAALKLFVRDGFNATDIRAIGKEAGYSNTAMFKFFKSKEALGLYLFERCYLLYANAFAAAVAKADTFEDGLEAVIGDWCEMLGENPDSFLFMNDHLREFLPLVTPDIRKKSVIAQAQKLIEQGKLEKKVGLEIETSMLIAALLGFMGQFARMLHFGGFKGGAMAYRSQIRLIIRKMILN